MPETEQKTVFQESHMVGAKRRSISGGHELSITEGEFAGSSRVITDNGVTYSETLQRNSGYVGKIDYDLTDGHRTRITYADGSHTSFHDDGTSVKNEFFYTKDNQQVRQHYDEGGHLIATKLDNITTEPDASLLPDVPRAELLQKFDLNPPPPPVADLKTQFAETKEDAAPKVTKEKPRYVMQGGKWVLK